MEETKTTQVQQGAGTYDFSQLLDIEEKEADNTKDSPSFEGFEEEENAPQETSEEDTTEVGETKEVDEDVDDKPEQKQKATSTGEPTYSSKVARRYIEEGIWEDYVVEYNGEEVKISEIEDLDDDTFFDIVRAQKSEQETNISTNYIDKSELDEISLDVIEISKNGGDITNVLKIKEEYINPLETYDLNDEEHQEALVRQMYFMENKALTQKQIDKLVESDKSELELETKALGFADKLKQSYKKILEKEKEQALEFKRQEEEQIKTLKKELKDEFKDLGYDKPSFVTPLINKATSQEEFAQEINSLRRDPKLLAEFLIWKNNPEEYKKNIASKEVKKEQVNTARKLNILRKESGSSKSSSSRTPEKKNNIEQEFFARLE